MPPAKARVFLSRGSWFDAIEKYVATLAGPTPDSSVWWLQDDSSGDVYCQDCAYNKAPERVDGGWRGEEDRIRHCDSCHVKLSCCLTGYGARQELDHWKGHGPPATADDWQDFEEMLNSIEDVDLPRLALTWLSWGLAHVSIAELWDNPIPARAASVLEDMEGAIDPCPRCLGTLIPVFSYRTERLAIRTCGFRPEAKRELACSKCGLLWSRHRFLGRAMIRLTALVVGGYRG